ncbi:MAG: hypothetical protein C4325_03000, partial [Blastocatellia bacterium]
MICASGCNQGAIYVAFELSVLHRLKFKSVALPVNCDPTVAVFLKRRGIAVSTNDLTQADWYRSIAAVQNDSDTLDESDTDLILENAYEPKANLLNPDLEEIFGPIDAIWFDNVRRNLERLNSNLKFALAADLVFRVGQYVKSFDQDTKHLRRPLSRVFRDLNRRIEPPKLSTVSAQAATLSPEEFIAQSQGNLLFLRLNPLFAAGSSKPDWREIWLRGPEARPASALCEKFTTRAGFFAYLARLLDRASHFDQWALSFLDDGFLTSTEIAEFLGRFRNVSAVYSKDFSELTGHRAI